jgi:hypothetical protein
MNTCVCCQKLAVYPLYYGIENLQVCWICKDCLESNLKIIMEGQAQFESKKVNCEMDSAKGKQIGRSILVAR